MQVGVRAKEWQWQGRSPGALAEALCMLRPYACWLDHDVHCFRGGTRHQQGQPGTLRRKSVGCVSMFLCSQICLLTICNSDSSLNDSLLEFRH